LDVDVWGNKPPKRCPNCRTCLVESDSKRRYETRDEHISDPNGESEPKTFFYCRNGECEIAWPACFWDHAGDFYIRFSPTTEKWYDANRVDTQDHRTFRRKGVTALDSWARMFDESMMYTRRNWFVRWRSRVRNRWHNWGCELRRLHSPYVYAWVREDAVEFDSWKHRFLYSFGVWIMDPSGKRWVHHATEACGGSGFSNDWHCVKQWKHHPYPWVRRKALIALQAMRSLEIMRKGGVDNLLDHKWSLILAPTFSKVWKRQLHTLAVHECS